MINAKLLKFQENENESNIEGDLMTDPTINDFKILTKAGHGGYGDVYKVQYQHQIYALKRTKRSHSNIESGILNLLKGKDHIVQLIWDLSSSIETDLVMEFTPIGSIYDLIKHRGRLSNLEGALFTKQVLKGLNTLHDYNIVHCDLKCSNLLVFKGGIVKICDFGLSQITNNIVSNTGGYFDLNGNRNITAVNNREGHEGSIYWLSPEIVKDHTRTYDFKCDIWSLGCCIVEMLKGKPPLSQFGYMKALHLLGQLQASDLDQYFGLADANFQCKKVLSACFTLDPSKRPLSFHVLELEWFQKNDDFIKYIEFGLEEEGLQEQKIKTQLLSHFKEDMEDDLDGFDFQDSELDSFGIWDLVNNLERADDDQIIHLSQLKLNKGHLKLLKNKILNLLQIRLFETNRWNSILELANTLFERDLDLLNKFIISGYLPKLLSQTPTESLLRFTKILKGLPQGSLYFQVAGGGLNVELHSISGQQQQSP